MQQTARIEPPLNALAADRSGDRRRLWALLGLLAVFYLLLAAGSTLWDRDEPRYARASVEMVSSGDWLVPTFNGDYRLYKPIFIYWLMGGAIAALGNSEVAVRLPSVIGWLAVIGMTGRIAQLMFDQRVAWWAMIITGTTLLSAYLAAAAMTDAVLVGFITASIYCFIHRVYHGPRWWQLPAVALTLGLAQLTKGPVGLALPIATFFTAGWLLRRQHIHLGGRWWSGLAVSAVLSIGIFLAWGIPADRATAGAFAEVGMGEQFLDRLYTAMEGHGGSNLLGYLATLPVYIPLLIACFFPWTLHLPGGLRAMIGGRIGDPRTRALLWAWILPTFIIMSLVATKLPHYILPIFPALAIVCAAGIELRRTDRMSDKDRDWLRGGIWFLLPVAVGAAVVMVGLPFWLGGPRLGILAALALLIVTGVAVVFQLRERVLASAHLLAVAGPLLFLLALAMLRPNIETHLKISDDIARAIRDKSVGVPRVWTNGYEEGSLFYYLDLPVDRAVRKTSSAVLAATPPGGNDEFVVIAADRLEPVIEAHGDIEPYILARHTVVNYSDTAEAQQILVLRWQVSRYRPPAESATGE